MFLLSLLYFRFVLWLISFVFFKYYKKENIKTKIILNNSQYFLIVFKFIKILYFQKSYINLKLYFMYIFFNLKLRITICAISIFSFLLFIFCYSKGEIKGFSKLLEKWELLIYCIKGKYYGKLITTIYLFNKKFIIKEAWP